MQNELKFEEVEMKENHLEVGENQPIKESWKGNPDYYQTGKKAGQLKPKAKIRKNKEVEKKSTIKEENEVDIDKELEQLNASFEGAEQLKSEQPNVNKVLISGTMLLIICDALFPSAIVFFYKKVKKSTTTVKAKDLRFSKEEKDELREVADAAAKQLLMEASPLSQFVISMTAVYCGKLIELA